MWHVLSLKSVAKSVSQCAATQKSSLRPLQEKKWIRNDGAGYVKYMTDGRISEVDYKIVSFEWMCSYMKGIVLSLELSAIWVLAYNLRR